MSENAQPPAVGKTTHVESLPKATEDEILSYLSATGACAVVVARDGTPHVVSAGGLKRFVRFYGQPIEVMWLKDHAEARRLVRLTQVRGSDIRKVAKSENIAISDNESTLRRAAAAAAQFEHAMAIAKMKGALSNYHGEYQRRRLEASSQGKRFLTFAQADARFRKAVIARLTKGEVVDESIVTEIFGGPES